MMNFRRIILNAFVSLGILVGTYGQELAVVYIQGDIQVYSTKDSPKTAKNLIYGPVLWDQTLILKAGSALKILRQNGEICELKSPGKYDISKLKFLPKSESSILSKFSSYFLSFFGSQNTSENKDYHYNSIYAVSRGEDDIPQLIFPFKDMVSMDENVLEFHWAHACDTCNFILQIYDFNSKALVFQSYMKSTTYNLSNPSKVLKPGKKYFWNIQLDKSNQKSNSNSFTVSEVGHFNQTLKNINLKLYKNNFNPNSLPGQILSIANFIENNQSNYAFQYARKIKLQNPKNKLLAEKLDAICQAELIKKMLE